MDVGKNLNGRGNRRADEFKRLLDDGAHLDRLDLFIGLPCEGQNLLDQIFGPIAGSQYLPQVIFQQRAFVDIIERQLRESDNGGKDIVEIVGDAAGKRSDGFHLVGLTQLCLHLFQFGDVGGDLQFCRPSIRPFNDPVMIDVPSFGVRVLLLPDVHTGKPSRLAFPLRLTPTARPRQPPDRLPAYAAGHILPVNFNHVPVHESYFMGLKIGHIDGRVDTVQNRDETLVVKPKFFFDLLSFGDIAIAGTPAEKRAILAIDRLAVMVDPSDGILFRGDSEVQRTGFPSVDLIGPQMRGHPVPVFGVDDGEHQTGVLHELIHLVTGDPLTRRRYIFERSPGAYPVLPVIIEIGHDTVAFLALPQVGADLLLL